MPRGPSSRGIARPSIIRSSTSTPSSCLQRELADQGRIQVHDGRIKVGQCSGPNLIDQPRVEGQLVLDDEVDRPFITEANEAEEMAEHARDGDLTSCRVRQPVNRHMAEDPCEAASRELGLPLLDRSGPFVDEATRSHPLRRPTLEGRLSDRKRPTGPGLLRLLGQPPEPLQVREPRCVEVGHLSWPGRIRLEEGRKCEGGPLVLRILAMGRKVSARNSASAPDNTFEGGRQSSEGDLEVGGRAVRTPRNRGRGRYHRTTADRLGVGLHRGLVHEPAAQVLEVLRPGTARTRGRMDVSLPALLTPPIDKLGGIVTDKILDRQESEEREPSEDNSRHG